MKMGFLSSSVFWGVVLVFFGISVILKAVLHIDIPLFRIFVGLLVIYFGLRILTGWHGGCCDGHSAVFSETRIDAKENQHDYSIVFGRGVIDSTTIPVKDKSAYIKIDTVFGESELLIDPEAPVRVEIDSAFAGATTPDGNTVSFGKLIYTTKNYSEKVNHLDIKADVVFGALRIVKK